MVNIGGAIITVVIILISMILHELAHGFTAYLLGDTTAKDDGRLTLNPLKHIDPYMSLLLPMILYLMGAPVFGGAKPVKVNPNNLKGREWGMALVAIAGPLTNFILAFISFLIWYFTKGQADFMFQAMTINLGFMIFNLIPIPPLDGSRAIYAIAPDGVRVFLNNIEQYGVFVVYMLILVLGNVFSGVMLGAMNGIYYFFRLIVGL